MDSRPSVASPALLSVSATVDMGPSVHVHLHKQRAAPAVSPQILSVHPFVSPSLPGLFFGAFFFFLKR